MTLISGTKQTKDLECNEHEHAFPFLASNKILGQLCSLWSTITKLYNRAWKAGRHIIITEEIFSFSQHAYTLLWPDTMPFPSHKFEAPYRSCQFSSVTKGPAFHLHVEGYYTQATPKAPFQLNTTLWFYLWAEQCYIWTIRFVFWSDASLLHAEGR